MASSESSHEVPSSESALLSKSSSTDSPIDSPSSESPAEPTSKCEMSQSQMETEEIIAPNNQTWVEEFSCVCNFSLCIVQCCTLACKWSSWNFDEKNLWIVNFG